MRGTASFSLVLLSFATLFASGCEAPGPEEEAALTAPQAELTQEESLGKLLFFDPMLSTPPGQACSHCHSPAAGFGDPNQLLPVSRGIHPDRYGNRNDMTVTYAAYIPPLAFDEEEGLWVGGLFWDGRAASLAEQAKGPPLNPLEMANPDMEAVIAAIREGSHRELFLEVYGEGSLDGAEVAYDHMANAIAAYEMTKEFHPFDSKYDRYLAGEVALTTQELHGLAIFEDETKGNCSACHMSRPQADGSPPLFTDFTYDNLGTPRNPMNPYYLLPPEFNPDGMDYVDLGLGPVVGDPELNGFFRVPTLRNVAITPPYMHNGVFHTLFEVMSFYNTRDVTPWPPPEVSTAVNRNELGDLGLTPDELESLVAFLGTLTDGFNKEG